MILIVLPAYNEAAGLPALLRSIRQVMDEGRLAYKVIVVDDGSSDGTWDVITAPPRRCRSCPSATRPTAGWRRRYARGSRSRWARPAPTT